MTLCMQPNPSRLVVPYLKTLVGIGGVLRLFYCWIYIIRTEMFTTRMDSICGPSPKSPIYEYNKGASSNGQAPSVWWHFFTFSESITSFSGVLSVITSLLSLVCCWVIKVVPDLQNLTSMYLICLARAQYDYLCWILRICMADRPLPDYLRALERLVRYSMLRSSSWFLVTLLSKYADQRPVIISTSLMSDVNV